MGKKGKKGKGKGGEDAGPTKADELVELRLRVEALEADLKAEAEAVAGAGADNKAARGSRRG